MPDESDDKIYFPVDQKEQAQQPSAKNLLPRGVYKKISKFIVESVIGIDEIEPTDSLADVSLQIKDLDECHNHNAILIDGDRGTGKTSVLFNTQIHFGKFLEVNEQSYLKDILWLKHIDPTKMENSDDLLLNTIVAALLSNEELKARLQKSPNNAEIFHKQLQSLSRALEGTQTHKDKFGIDKLRSFMGNKSLAEQIHRLYCLAARITGKKLVVLPIDDVDTSLNLAFDNVEVIRKYLSSPYVLPIVSGNLGLYHEIIWRHFHGRLIKDSQEGKEDLVVTAQELSRNYQQKVLPLPRQIRMPNIKQYFANDKIYLTCPNGNKPDLKFFYYWVESVVNQQTAAGIDNYLNIPVKSIRDLVQLVSFCSREIEQLNAIENLTKNKVHRLTIMPLVTAQALDDFESEYGQAASELDGNYRRDRREQAYQSLEQALMRGENLRYKEIAQTWQTQLRKRIVQLLGWNKALKRYLRHKRSGGQSYMVCVTNELWLNLVQLDNVEKEIGHSVLNSPLFNPLETRYNAQFDMKYEIRFERFQTEISSQQANTPVLSLFNFPSVDLGRRTDNLRPLIEKKWIESSKISDIFDIFYSLTHHRAASNTDNRYDYWRIGRIFELLVMSLVKPLHIVDIKQLISRPPFYCEASLLEQGQTIYDQHQSDILDDESMELHKLIEDINEWRTTHFVQVPSSWLIHQLMIKVFTNVKIVYQGKDFDEKYEFIELCYRAFLMIVGACGSVEKSNIFGLGQRVALIEVEEDLDKFRNSDLYNLNIRPYTELPKGVGSITRSLFYHPIGAMLRNAIEYCKHEGQVGDEEHPATGSHIEEVVSDELIEEGIDDELENLDESYSDSSIEQEREADESVKYIHSDTFELIGDSNEQDFGGLKLRYGEQQLREMAIVAGVVFYTTYSMFKGRSVSHGHIKSLTKVDFDRLDVNLLAKKMIEAGLPKDFVVILFKDPKRFLSAKTNYRKLTTFIARYISLGGTLNESELEDD